MNRKPLQGLWTVLRFNWHFFAIALAGNCLLVAGSRWLEPPLASIAITLAALGSLTVGGSLAATVYAYDLTGIYSLQWLDAWLTGVSRAANVHAGFDETTLLLKERFPSIDWLVLDFYAPSKHTELSLRRARKASPPPLETQTIATDQIRLASETLDRVVLTLAAHEIRDEKERNRFFRELHRVLKADGYIILTEHLRNLPNIIAYSLGAWHFHSRSEWLRTFEAAGFQITAEIRLNNLITTFILGKHGTTP
jgi:SAM-dependent methyltransferase